MQILVTGGTGTLGRVVVRKLIHNGHSVRVLSRRERPADDHAPHGWATADLKTGAGLAEAFAGIDVVVHCANDQRASGDRGMPVTRQVVQAAKQAGSPHLVYVSIVGVDAIPLGYYRAKLADERLIEASGLPHTILRATQFHDLVRTIFAASAKLPVMFVPGVRFQPIDVRDVAARLAGLAAAEPAGRAADLGGPEVADARALARSYLRAAGKRRPVVGVSLPGRIFRALRRGAGITPEHAVEGVTFAQYLADREPARS